MAKRYGHIGESPQRDAMKLLDRKEYPVTLAAEPTTIQ